MAADEKIQGIRQFVSNFPLQEILDTAEVVAKIIPVPGIGLVVKILKTSIKFLPVADRALDASGKIAANIENSKNIGMSAAKDKFNTLMDIAMTDGIITNQEKEFLRTKAQEVGISDDEFEMMIISNTNQQ